MEISQRVLSNSRAHGSALTPMSMTRAQSADRDAAQRRIVFIMRGVGGRVAGGRTTAPARTGCWPRAGTRRRSASGGLTCSPSSNGAQATAARARHSEHLTSPPPRLGVGSRGSPFSSSATRTNPCAVQMTTSFGRACSVDLKRRQSRAMPRRQQCLYCKQHGSKGIHGTSNGSGGRQNHSGNVALLHIARQCVTERPTAAQRKQERPRTEVRGRRFDVRRRNRAGCDVGT